MEGSVQMEEQSECSVHASLLEQLNSGGQQQHMRTGHLHSQMLLFKELSSPSQAAGLVSGRGD